MVRLRGSACSCLAVRKERSLVQVARRKLCPPKIKVEGRSLGIRLGRADLYQKYNMWYNTTIDNNFFKR